ncbi:hypothetical protein D9615_001517 [Tricholomella constricta]|uniref:CCHC-type domain-containing protein n=1 Tax=Tricholomella constricta TaxID=117010 RepID=A0A8H5M921_9AGAR|nr:hypothetical protein D9615_001517 [Tricholomella constricta]
MSHSSRTPSEMPSPRAKDAPEIFKGNYKDIQRFLSRFNNLCKLYNVPDPEKCDRILDYCSYNVTQLIQGLQSYHDQDWKALEKKLLWHYDADRRDSENNISNLKRLVNSWSSREITTLTRWKKYEREFVTIGGRLLKDGMIGEEEQACYFWEGIHKDLRQNIELRVIATNPSLSLKKAIPIAAIVEAVERIFERNRFDYHLAKPRKGRTDDSDYSSDENEDSESDEDLKKKYKKSKSKKNKRYHYSSSDTESESEEEEVIKKYRRKQKPSKKLPKARISETPKKIPKSEVDDLIDQLAELSIDDPKYGVLYYRAYKLDNMITQCLPPPRLNIQQHDNSNNRMRQPFMNQPPQQRAPIREPYPAQSSGNIFQRQPPPHMSQNPNGYNLPPRGPLICFGCGKEGHGMRSCVALQDRVQRGELKRDDFGKITFKDGSLVQRNGNETIIQAVDRHLNNRLASHLLTIEPYEVTDSFKDSSDYYISDQEDDEEPEAVVFAAEQEPRMITRARKDAIDKVTRPIRKGKEPQRDPPADGFRTRNVGPSKALKEPRIPLEDITPTPVDVRQPRVVQRTTDDVVMVDANPPRTNPQQLSQQQGQSKTRAPVRQSQISAQVDEKQVVTQILNTPLTLRLGEVLASSREVSDQLVDLMKRKNLNSKPPAVEHVAAFAANAADAASAANAANSRDSTSLIRIPLRLEDKRVLAIIDTGSELNVINRDFVRDLAETPIDPQRKVVISDANGGAGNLQGHISDIVLRCGSVETIANLYVGDDMPFDLLLGRPWQRQNLVSIDERIDGTYLLFKDRKNSNISLELLVKDRAPRPDYPFNLQQPPQVNPFTVGIVTQKSPIACEDPIEALEFSSEFWEQLSGLYVQNSGLNPSGSKISDIVPTPIDTSTERQFINLFPEDFETLESDSLEIDSRLIDTHLSQEVIPYHEPSSAINTTIARQLTQNDIKSLDQFPKIDELHSIESISQIGSSLGNLAKQIRDLHQVRACARRVKVLKSTQVYSLSSDWIKRTMEEFRISDISAIRFHRFIVLQICIAQERIVYKFEHEALNSTNIPTFQYTQTEEPNSAISMPSISPPPLYLLALPPNDVVPPPPAISIVPNMTVAQTRAQLDVLSMIWDRISHGIEGTHSVIIAAPRSVRIDPRPLDGGLVENMALFDVSMISFPNGSGTPAVRSGNVYLTFVDRDLATPNIVCNASPPPPVRRTPDLSIVTDTPSTFEADNRTPSPFQLYSQISQGTRTDHPEPRAEFPITQNAINSIIRTSSPSSPQPSASVLALAAGPLRPFDVSLFPEVEPVRVYRAPTATTQASAPFERSTDTPHDGIGKEEDVDMESSEDEPGWTKTRRGRKRTVGTTSLSSSTAAASVDAGSTARSQRAKRRNRRRRDGKSPLPLPPIRASLQNPFSPLADLTDSLSSGRKLKPADDSIAPDIISPPLRNPQLLPPDDSDSSYIAPTTVDVPNAIDDSPAFSSSIVQETISSAAPDRTTANDWLADEDVPLELRELRYPDPLSTTDANETGTSAPIPSSNNLSPLITTINPAVLLPPFRPRTPSQHLLLAPLPTIPELEPSHFTIPAPRLDTVPLPTPLPTPPPASHPQDHPNVTNPEVDEQLRRESTSSIPYDALDEANASPEFLASFLAKPGKEDDLSDSTPGLMTPDSSSDEMDVSPRFVTRDLPQDVIGHAIGEHTNVFDDPQYADTWDDAVNELLDMIPNRAASPPFPVPSSELVLARSRPTFKYNIDLIYQRITQDRDEYGFVDARSFDTFQAGIDTPIRAPVSGSTPPPGHPAWCAKHKTPIVRHHFMFDFEGEVNNHPLLDTDNSLSTPDPESIDPKSDFAIPFLNAANIICTTRVISADWKGFPETPQRQAIRLELWQREQADRLLPLSRPTTYTKYSTYDSRYPRDRHTSEDSPATWEDRPHGKPGPNGYFDTHFISPYDHTDDAVAFNLVNPVINSFREARSLIDDGIRATCLDFLAPEFRLYLNTVDDSRGTRHYFRYHCPYFRIFDTTRPYIQQGFATECIHYDYPSPIMVLRAERTEQPRNPLLSDDEDEFLYHAAKVYESRANQEVANAMRRLRDCVPYLPDHVFLLFDYGYLHSIHHFDNNGLPFPLLWDSPVPRL